MNKYVIDYGYGRADFYTEAVDPEGTPTEMEMFQDLALSPVRREFLTCATACFGIRKYLGDYRLLETYLNVELPLPYRGHGGTHFLSHHGDEILFDSHYEQVRGEYWKLHSEGGGWCSCKERGKPELSCDAHHFWVPEHDSLCACQNKEAAAIPIFTSGGPS